MIYSPGYYSASLSSASFRSQPLSLSGRKTRRVLSSALEAGMKAPHGLLPSSVDSVLTVIQNSSSAISHSVSTSTSAFLHSTTASLCHTIESVYSNLEELVKATALGLSAVDNVNTLLEATRLWSALLVSGLCFLLSSVSARLCSSSRRRASTWTPRT